MKTISVRNISDEAYAYESLKAMAEANHRSMQEQVRLIIEREARLGRCSAVAKARAWRERLAGRVFVDAVTEVREDRSR